MMIQFRPNKLKAYNKIVLIIDSCKTASQLSGAYNMIVTFSKVFSDDSMIDDFLSLYYIKEAIIKQ
tara:strand:+ start:2976 stop:3173 length:198 start_codon:yes stop_codon:yes gene_type:complete